MPVSAGSALSSCVNASSPPAEAPTPTIGNDDAFALPVEIPLGIFAGQRRFRELIGIVVRHGEFSIGSDSASAVASTATSRGSPPPH